tara:strand:+ start:153 stop:668 length:516 start_codon:yes stop_codon:yes gene_type:complete
MISKLQKEVDFLRAENAAMLRQIDALRSTHKNEIQANIECCEALRWQVRQERGKISALSSQLEHERREREAAQRTIAILGGGLDEFEWPVCANNDCVNEVRSKRSNALYCSDQCKWAVQKRRARAKLAPCQNEKCIEKLEGKRKGARYCSSRCKSAAGVRRHRATNGGGES